MILPDMKNSIYILDECHHFPEKALSHFAKQSPVLRSFDWINTIGKILSKAILYN
jgi:ATP-dependent DNA helicase DinG